MADIKCRNNQILNSLVTVYYYLRKNKFAVTNEIDFNLAFTKLKNFFKLDDTETALFTAIIENYFSTNERPVSLTTIASDLETNPLKLVGFREDFKSLEEKGFIYADSIEDACSNASSYRVNEKVVSAVVKQDEHLLTESLHIKDNDLIYPEEIKEKQLFYMNSIKDEVNNLTEYLSKDKLEAIQERLVEKSMSKGVCIMLYGASGTGKTETVYQLAKKTGRAVYHVDIGSVISCWHGGTERNLSNVFEKYSKLCKRCQFMGEETPILLFNEADALFGKRINAPQHGAEIDENHIQSLLLDYIETQEGILIVTTNVAENFDEAFERRFLFKIKFEKPDQKIKEKIWKNKIEWLNAESAEILATSYSFSGGEIDNIVRKATMKEVLTGKRSSFKELESYCQKEKLEQKNCTRIGFGS